MRIHAVGPVTMATHGVVLNQHVLTNYRFLKTNHSRTVTSTTIGHQAAHRAQCLLLLLFLFRERGKRLIITDACGRSARTTDVQREVKN